MSPIEVGQDSAAEAQIRSIVAAQVTAWEELAPGNWTGG